MTTTEQPPRAGWRRHSLPLPPVFAVFPWIDEAFPWIDEAACRGRSDVFYGPAGERREGRDEREARAPEGEGAL